jgi:hypothetical protein
LSFPSYACPRLPSVAFPCLPLPCIPLPSFVLPCLTSPCLHLHSPAFHSLAFAATATATRRSWCYHTSNNGCCYHTTLPTDSHNYMFHNIITTILPTYNHNTITMFPNYYHNTILSQYYHNTTTATATARVTATATATAAQEHITTTPPQCYHNYTTIWLKYKQNTMYVPQSNLSNYLLPQCYPNTTAILPRPRPRPATATATVHYWYHYH